MSCQFLIPFFYLVYLVLARQRVLTGLQLYERPPECPPCFNCNLEDFNCLQYGQCSSASGKCRCPSGFGGPDCAIPVCDSPVQAGNRTQRGENHACDCTEGWTGINCNVCQTNDACNGLMPERNGGVCYVDSPVVRENQQMCNVTNRKIIDQLKDRQPQITIACNATAETCAFQFWIGQVESFYCGLDTCVFDHSDGKDLSRCENIHCSCIPGRMLCGESGSIDIGEFLSEEIKGPATLSRDQKTRKSKFEEPAMNDLIKSVFGDDYITLECTSGECLYRTEVPGYVRPVKQINTPLIAGVIAGCALFVVLVILLVWYLARKSYRQGPIHLVEDEHNIDVKVPPVTLQCENISYQLGDKMLLSEIYAVAHPGQLLAIMGASGAGKSTFLDILARKNKRGSVTGSCHVNGHKVEDEDFRRCIGFVDQEDTMLPTLTVHETILTSALLRLPRDMSLVAKEQRVREAEKQLGILHIKDQLIGSEASSGGRGISGGEKRRVGIACELVTSPSVLFLDEPTSGLDAYNAYNVMECLVMLARNYNRTIICTIHQPRSNIVALFDQLLLLARGHMIYSGPFSSCQQYFAQIGFDCPSGFNIADFIIDLSMQAAPKGIRTQSSSVKAVKSIASNISIGSSSSGRLSVAEDDLVSMYQDSSIAAELRKFHIVTEDTPPNDTTTLSNYERIGYVRQFGILSQRTWRNLYRNPMLMLTHYAVAIILAVLSGVLFYGLTDDIKGFQNRLGLFFFLLALFGFSTLTSLNVFSSERLLFVRERANGYYSPFTYFAAKVIFDIVPLRLIPPLIMGAIVYPMSGLTTEWPNFFTFLLIMVLFNLAAAAVCLFIGIVFRDGAVANLIGSLVMLFSLLFAGLLLNHDAIPKAALWLQTLSIFHYGFEALIVNEVKYLTLVDHKYGLDIEVPGASILSAFGFNNSGLWPDIAGLAVFAAAFIAIAYMAMHLLLVEKR